MPKNPGDRKLIWKGVNHANPCPICGKSDWCRISSDGSIAACRRIEAGAWKTKTDKNGAIFYLHRLNADTASPPAMGLPHRKSSAERADAETRHRIYSALLASLQLTASHQAQLRARGLPDDEIGRRLYRSLQVQGRARIARTLADRFGGEELLSIPGLVLKDGKYITLAGCAGLLIPCRDANGNIVALKIRSDNAENGPRYTILSSAKYDGPSGECAVHVPLGIETTAEAVRLTEGEIKADIAYVLDGLPTISVPGISNWRSCLPTLRAFATKKVVVSFDADVADNPVVARALSGCYNTLTAEGFAISLERWDARHKGIDDLLAAGGRAERIEGDAARTYIADCLLTAKAAEPTPPSSPLERLTRRLGEGAEAFFADRELLAALAALAENDPAEWQCIRAKIKGGGVGLRNVDAAIAPARQQLRREKPPPSATAEYKVVAGQTVFVKGTKDGPVDCRLANFAARITEQIYHDDGAEKTIHFVVDGQLYDGTPLPPCEITADKFAAMGWTVGAWGTRAVISAGSTMRDHLRAAIQHLSGDVPTRTVYSHLGWRQIDNRLIYLHAGGAIGETGVVDGVEVEPPPALQRYILPPPPTGDALREAVRASLAVLEFAPPRLAYPLLAAVYRAPLGPCDFTLHLMGQSGVYKSEIAALLQQHYGAGMDRANLPASWSSTANAVEALAFAAKDAVMVVDDFAPNGATNDVARLHREAERLLRAQGNGAGRQRMRRDGSLAAGKSPRGLILSTGEDVPRGQSIRARLLIVDVGSGDFGPPPPEPNEFLSRRQREASQGRYAEAMVAYLQWLAPRMSIIRERIGDERTEIRDVAAAEGQHARTPTAVADLGLGLQYLLEFAVAVGAIDTSTNRRMWDEGWESLRELGRAQAHHANASNPVDMFLRLLSAAIISGRAHVAAVNREHPDNPAAWGWRREDGRSGPDWRPYGRRVGWIDGEDLLLEPEAAYAAAQHMAVEQGESLSVSPQVLRRRVRDRGLLLSIDIARETLTVRRVVDGVSRNVLHLRADVVNTKPDKSDKPDSGPEFSEDLSGSGCRVFSPDGPNPTSNPTSNPTAKTDQNEQNVGFVGSGDGAQSSTDGKTSQNPRPGQWTSPTADPLAMNNPFA